ncbi:MAG TPA: class I SAM-dependent methyltransferase [Phnomibacter sp.]|nr:class I SAM-dependent methyltransferase [Phnomibacter sp.]
MRTIFCVWVFIGFLSCLASTAGFAQGQANKHMHHRSFEQLVQEFERPDRDFWQRPDTVFKYLAPLQGKKIMDIGCGSGYFSFKLQEKGATVIAADIDERFLKYVDSTREARGINAKSLQTRKLPPDNPMLAKREADVVLIVNTYHHLENRTDYLRKIKAGLKGSGYVVIVDFLKKQLPVGPPPELKLSSDEVVRDLKMAGFSTFKVEETVLPYQYMVLAM